jgi:hypothetical protein
VLRAHDYHSDRGCRSKCQSTTEHGTHTIRSPGRQTKNKVRSATNTTYCDIGASDPTPQRPLLPYPLPCQGPPHPPHPTPCQPAQTVKVWGPRRAQPELVHLATKISFGPGRLASIPLGEQKKPARACAFFFCKQMPPGLWHLF